MSHYLVLDYVENQVIFNNGRDDFYRLNFIS